jgi:8-oxo-dGTP diphosphatase
MWLELRALVAGRARGRTRWIRPDARSPEAPGSEPIVACARSPADLARGADEDRWVAVLLEHAAASDPRPKVPTLVDLPEGVVGEGDEVAVDADRGRVELPGVERVDVVTSFLEREDGAVLLLRRSDRVGSFRGRWAGVSGFLESIPPLAQALTEIREETGIVLAPEALRRSGAPVLARDGRRVFAVHPFRFGVRTPEVRLDWEHTEYRWIRPEEIGAYLTVPRLEEVWRRVASDAPRPAGDSGPKET